MYSWKDKLIDWANRKGAWTHILVGAGIALVILAIILAAAMPSKGVVNTNAASIAETQDTVGTIANALGTKASQAEFDALSGDVTDALGDQAADISEIDERTRIAEEKLTQARIDITTIQGQMTTAINSSLTATLAGTFGNYTLSVKSDEVGDFMATVHLVYQPSAGNTTSYADVLDDFYTTVNWTVNATISSYVPVGTFDGTSWGITEIWWNVGTFELVADTEKTFEITCAGLNSMWEPSYAYVEVWPVLQ